MMYRRLWTLPLKDILYSTVRQQDDRLRQIIGVSWLKLAFSTSGVEMFKKRITDSLGSSASYTVVCCWARHCRLERNI